MIQEDTIVTSDCVERTTGACNDEPFFDEHEGKRYCVLHFPGSDKKQAFDFAFEKKQDAYDSNYQGVWFPRGNWFTGLEICQPLDFTYACFNDGVSFHNTIFRHAVKFNGVIFNDDISFGHATFGGEVDFSSATFRNRAEFRNAVFLQTASFWSATFNSTASFYQATFARANFSASEFKDKATFDWCDIGFGEFVGVSFGGDASFFSVTFDGMASFNRAKFDRGAQFICSKFHDEARFTSTTLNGETDFGSTVFKDFVTFSAEYGSGGFGKNAACDFRNARFEMPKRVSFHSVMLRPHWFVNLDPREFQFIDVKWIASQNSKFVDNEIAELVSREGREERHAADRRAERLRDATLSHDEVAIEDVKKEEAEARIRANQTDQARSRFHRLLSIACRQLAVNAEENHRYDEASDFRFWSMDLRRKEGWKARGRLSIGILHALYRLLSGYGEEIGRALLILIGIWLLFALLYTKAGFARPPSAPAPAAYSNDEIGAPQKLTKALAYSLATITLQRPDPRPLTATAWFLVLAESILGPIQAALLILAVRRRFMR